MPVLAIAIHVDDDVGLEFLPILDRQHRRENDRHGIVSIDVEYRRLDHSRNIRTVTGGPRFVRSRRKANLIVHDDVKRASRPIARQLRKIQYFGHQSLSREGRIAMNENG